MLRNRTYTTKMAQPIWPSPYSADIRTNKMQISAKTECCKKHYQVYVKGSHALKQQSAVLILYYLKFSKCQLKKHHTKIKKEPAD